MHSKRVCILFTSHIRWDSFYVVFVAGKSNVKKQSGVNSKGGNSCTLKPRNSNRHSSAPRSQLQHTQAYQQYMPAAPYCTTLKCQPPRHPR